MKLMLLNIPQKFLRLPQHHVKNNAKETIHFIAVTIASTLAV